MTGQPGPTVPAVTAREWDLFLTGWEHGYDDGVRDGIGIGRAQANQKWTDTTTLACRAALTGGGFSHAELERRRTTLPAARAHVGADPGAGRRVLGRRVYLGVRAVPVLAGPGLGSGAAPGLGDAEPLDGGRVHG
jgi:hypothetical protein